MTCNCPKCSYADLPQQIEELAPNTNDNEYLSPTEFKCINRDGEVVTLDGKYIPAGTLIDYGDKCEAFRALSLNEKDKPWVLYTNLKMSHETFAEMMRSRYKLPKIVYWGL